MVSGWFPLNAALARRLVPSLLAWRLSANQVTLFSLSAGILGSLFFLRGDHLSMVAGAVGFLAANLLDECDGSVARATGTSSGFGSWLDTLVGCGVHMAFFASLGIGLTYQSGQTLWSGLGFLTAAGVLISTVAYVISQSCVRGRAGWIHPDPPRQGEPDRFAFLKGMLRTDFSMVVLGSVLLGQIRWILWGGLIGSFCFWIPSDLWMAMRLRRGGVG